MRTRSLFHVLVATLAAVGLLGSGALAAPSSPASQAFIDGIEQAERYFDANPELKETPGSGWKPFNRTKWFWEQRMVDGELPPPGARWNVWQEKVRREQSQERSGSGTWFQLGPENLAGRMLALAFDWNDPSNTVYAGAASGGLWRTTDAGASWTPLTDDLPTLAVGGVGVSVNDSNILVIGTGEATPNVQAVGGVGILRSTDAGASWDTTNVSYLVSGNSGFHFVEVNPVNGTMLAGENNGLWRSTDDGATWEHVRTNGSYYDAVWVPGSSTTVFAVRGNSGNSGSNVKISTDDGVTWAKAGTGQPAGWQIGKSRIAMSPANDQRIYAYFGDFGTGGGILGIWRSTDQGATWAQRTGTGVPSGQSWYNLTLALDADNSSRVFAGAVSLGRSGNAATSFSQVGFNVHPDHHDTAYEPGSNTNLWVAGDGGVYRSTNDGDSWTDLNNGLVTYQFYDICVNNGPTAYYLLGGTQDNGTNKYTGTPIWAMTIGADGMVCEVDPTNGTKAYAEIQFGSHRRSTDSGNSWSNFNSGLSGSGQWVTPTAHDPNRTNHLYTETSAGVFRSSNGTSWTQVSTHRADWISISAVDGDYVWTVRSNSAYISTDDGGTWTEKPFGMAVGAPTKILAHPTELNTAFVTTSTYNPVGHILRTTDLGNTWQDHSGDFPGQPVNAIAVNPSDPSEWYIGTDVSVWKSTNEGVNWLPFGGGLPNVVVLDLEIQDELQKLVAGTHGRGAWEMDLVDTGTGVDVVAGSSPSNILFDRPFPNPVRDQAVFRYAAKHEGRVTLRVYDIQGRLITDLAEYSRGDGIIRTTSWLTDDVPSGVYFAVLATPSERVSRKVVVAR